MNDVASFFPTAQIGLHVAISLVALAAGAIVIGGMLAGRHLGGWAGVFLWTTIATSFSGFFLPAEKILPSHIVGAVSLVVLGVALFALYCRRLSGAWRRAYVVSAVAAFYLNVFVLIVQSFLKVSALHALAPSQSDPPFAIAQGIAFTVFAVLGVVADTRFRPISFQPETDHAENEA